MLYHRQNPLGSKLLFCCLYHCTLWRMIRNLFEDFSLLGHSSAVDWRRRSFRRTCRLKFPCLRISQIGNQNGGGSEHKWLIPPKRRLTSVGLHCVTSPKTEIFTVAAVRTSDSASTVSVESSHNRTWWWSGNAIDFNNGSVLFESRPGQQSTRLRFFVNIFSPFR